MAPPMVGPIICINRSRGITQRTVLSNLMEPISGQTFPSQTEISAMFHTLHLTWILKSLYTSSFLDPNKFIPTALNIMNHEKPQAMGAFMATSKP